MKRFSILLIVCALLITSAAVFADYNNGVNDDGIVIWSATGSKYSNIKEINRSNVTYDTDTIGKDQLTQLTIEAKAYIPCYLRMEFNGNNGKTVLESFGPEGKNGVAQAVRNEDKYHIVFENEIGGFVDRNWNSLGHGRNAEIGPGSNVFLQGCDIFHVKIYSNDDFKYDVISKPLAQSTRLLPLEMGYSTAVNGPYTLVTFDAPKTVNIGSGAPCATLEYYHRFRVPYSASVASGEYSGSVTFKAYTI
jgi:hypothetical protein